MARRRAPIPQGPELDIVIDVECPDWEVALADLRALVAGAVRAAMKDAPQESAEISILLADDRLVRDLNHRYRGKDKATNVLSFPLTDGRDVRGPHGAPVVLGDVVLAFGTVKAEAEAQGKALGDHLAHLVVHGVLHLLGLDHEDEAEAEAMEARETAILSTLGIADPYRDDKE